MHKLLRKVTELNWTIKFVCGVISLHIKISSVCSAQGQVLHCKHRNQGYNSAEGRSSHQTHKPLLQFYQGWIGAVASHCFLHPTLSLASEQTLKIWEDPRGPNVEVRRVDLANWALWTSPKFTTGVKYQFHQGFWPDQRSGNPNYLLPQHKLIFTYKIKNIKYISFLIFFSKGFWLYCKCYCFTLTSIQLKILEKILMQFWPIVLKLQVFRFTNVYNYN